MKTLASSQKSRFRYLPALAEQRKWGLFLTDWGYTVIEPGTPYPPRGHPDAYADGWTKGRTLAEYQVIYITRGRGTFETRRTGRRAIEAGEILVLLGLIQERVPSAGAKGRISGLIREAQNHILMNATAAIDFKRLAGTLWLGYTTFRHRFKEQTGIPPAQFQNAIRISRAQDLLSSTDLSVSEIAAQTVFGTVFYFSRHFKTSTSLTPKAYRAQFAPGPSRL